MLRNASRESLVVPLGVERERVDMQSAMLRDANMLRAARLDTAGPHGHPNAERMRTERRRDGQRVTPPVAHDEITRFRPSKEGCEIWDAVPVDDAGSATNHPTRHGTP